MTRILWAAVVCLGATSAATAAELPKPMVTGLKAPTAVAVGPDGRIYVTVLGDQASSAPDNNTRSGAVLVIDKGEAVAFATGFDRPQALVFFGESLFVLDPTQVWRVNRQGKTQIYAGASAFPTSPVLLTDIDVDEQGVLYIPDFGDTGKRNAAIFRVDTRGKVTIVTDQQRNPAIVQPVSLKMDGMSHVLVSVTSEKTTPSELVRVKLSDGSTTRISPLSHLITTGLVWDKHGRLFLTSSRFPETDSISAIPRPGAKFVSISNDFANPGKACLDPTGKLLLIPDTGGEPGSPFPRRGTITAIPTTIPGWEVDETPLPIKTEVAFPNLEWTGWKREDDKGKPNPLRPLVLTHAGDGSNRVFVATEHGVIHVFPNDQKATKTQVFLDIQDRVTYRDDQNEEGFLGLAFHPKCKENGEFFVFYTTKKAPLTNIISRFHVSKEDPNRADPNSEEILLKITKPFWNHDGGTLTFGPDGYLYFAHGDGGAANDPFGNGQKLNTFLGKVLRIDVDHKDPGKNYAVPKDNPFVDKPDARPEIWAYGLRNVWRMAFDRKTGVLWASDVGQNLYEEIDHIVKGGNYGWNLREGLHPFGPNGAGPRKDLIEPIWEYHHDVGKSLTGGTVYHGKRLPELDGYYLYADYVSTRIWGLRHDDGKKRVVANRRISDPNVAVMSFGEDEQGEVYFMTYSATGRGIYWFTKAGEKQ